MYLWLGTTSGMSRVEPYRSCSPSLNSPASSTDQSTLGSCVRYDSNGRRLHALQREVPLGTEQERGPDRFVIRQSVGAAFVALQYHLLSALHPARQQTCVAGSVQRRSGDICAPQNSITPCRTALLAFRSVIIG